MSKLSLTMQRRRMLLAWSSNHYPSDWSTPSLSVTTNAASGGGTSVGPYRLIVADLYTCFAWTGWTHLAYATSGNRRETNAAIYIAAKFLFAWLPGIFGGGSTNPLTTLTSSRSFSANGYGVLAAFVFRVPAQVVGSTMGIWIVTIMYPNYNFGSFLEVDIYVGAVMHGILAFTMVMVYLNTIGMGVFLRTFICAMTRMLLNKLGTGITNGWLNPASAFGWAYLTGTHNTKEHIVVYWLAPILSTLFAMQLFDSFKNQEGSLKVWKLD